MKKLLLIEDDLVLRENTAEILVLSNFEVITASNGIEGVALAKSSMPDIIISDIMMPELNGHQVLEILANDERTKFIPFIFLSAKTERKDVRKGMNMGADDYITKPFKEEELKVKIELTLASIQAKASLQETSNEAMNMAMTAMTSASEIGQILQFIRDSYTCKSYAELADLTIELYQAYGLDVILRINDEGKLLYFSQFYYV